MKDWMMILLRIGLTNLKISLISKTFPSPSLNKSLHGWWNERRTTSEESYRSKICIHVVVINYMISLVESPYDWIVSNVSSKRWFDETLERATLYVFSRPFKISSRRITSNGNRSSSSRVSYEETRWMKGCCVIYYRFPQKYVHRVFTTLTSLFRIGYAEGNDEFIWMRYAVGCNFNQVNYRELFFQSCKQVCFHCIFRPVGETRWDTTQPSWTSTYSPKKNRPRASVIGVDKS